jgi:hypothetical protein
MKVNLFKIFKYSFTSISMMETVEVVRCSYLWQWGHNFSYFERTWQLLDFAPDAAWQGLAPKVEVEGESTHIIHNHKVLSSKRVDTIS